MRNKTQTRCLLCLWLLVLFSETPSLCITNCIEKNDNKLSRLAQSLDLDGSAPRNTMSSLFPACDIW